MFGYAGGVGGVGGAGTSRQWLLGISDSEKKGKVRRLVGIKLYLYISLLIILYVFLFPVTLHIVLQNIQCHVM